MTVYDIKTNFGAIGNGVADDAPAFVLAGNTLNGTSGNQLLLPAGTYKFGSLATSGGRDVSRWILGIPQLTVTGAGVGSTTVNVNNFCNQFGGQGQFQNGNNWGKVDTVSSGSYSVNLQSLSDASKFSVNGWVLLTGLNIQDIYSDVPAGYGYPSNLHYLEYLQVASISGTIVTFTTPLVNSYLSTWPNLNTGTNFEINSGGPAGMYALPSTWNTVIEYQGITFTTAGTAQIYAPGKSVTYRNCAFSSTFSPIPTTNQTWAAYNCTSPSTFMEADKLVTNMIMDGCTWGTLDFQSSSITNVTLSNSTMSVVGTGLNTSISNCIMALCKPGAFAYGASQDLTITNCQVTTWGTTGFNEKGPSDLGVEKWATMSSGVIAVPNGTSVSNITDNGSGKARYTVTKSAGFVSGKYQSVGQAYQTLVTNGTTLSGTSVLNFASVPTWITAGVSVKDATGNDTIIPGGSTVLSKTATTVTISNPVSSTINSGVNIRFYPSQFFGNQLLLAVPNATTIDVDVAFPSGFVYGGGAGFGNSALRWAVPGKAVYFGGWSNGNMKKFKINSVTQDADSMYATTDQTGGFPSVPGGAPLWIVTPVAQHIKATGLTGSDPYNAQLLFPESYNKPLGTYFKSQVTSSQQSATANVWGNLVAIKVNVITPYTGTLPNLFLHLNTFDNLPFLVDGTSTPLGWGIDARTPGMRVILPTNTVTNSTAKPNDSSLLVPAWTTSLWLSGGPGTVFTNTKNPLGPIQDISGESSSLWPNIIVEFIVDQNFPDTPNPPVDTLFAGKMKGELFKPKIAQTYHNKYPEERRKEIQKSAKILASVGGHARAASLTPQQRTQIAMKAANTRWK